jgi:hypothetical protein
MATALTGTQGTGHREQTTISEKLSGTQGTQGTDHDFRETLARKLWSVPMGYNDKAIDNLTREIDALGVS